MSFDDIVEIFNLFPTWFKIVLIGVTAVGAVTALAGGKKKFNRLLWLIVACVSPIFGTVVTIVAFVVMGALSKGNKNFDFECPFRKSYVIAPFIVGISGFYISSELSDDDIAQTVTVTLSLTVIFLQLVYSYVKSHRKRLLFYIFKNSGKVVSEQVSEYIYGHECHDELAEAVPDVKTAYAVAKHHYQTAPKKSDGEMVQACFDSPDEEDKDRQKLPIYNYKAGEEEYMYTVIDTKGLRGDFDVETAEYMGSGITRLKVLEWKKNLSGKFRIGKEDAVYRISMWNILPPFMPCVLESLTDFLFVTVIFTPCGLKLFCNTLKFFSGFFS